MAISVIRGVDPLQTTLLELGIVSGKVALLLRSAEIHPVFERFVDGLCPSSPFSPLWKRKSEGGETYKTDRHGSDRTITA